MAMDDSFVPWVQRGGLVKFTVAGAFSFPPARIYLQVLHCSHGEWRSTPSPTPPARSSDGDSGIVERWMRVAKYLLQGSYSVEGNKGVLKSGGTARKVAIKSLVEGVGGQLECVYFSFGADD